MAAEQVGTDFRVPAFQFVVGGLADVVQQSAASSQIGVHSQHFGDQAGDERNFDAVPQHVLAVRGAEVKPAEHLEESVVQSRAR